MPGQQGPERPWPSWVALAGSLLVGVSFVLPWTELLDRKPTGWQLLARSSELLEHLDQAKQRRDRLPSLPQARLPESAPPEQELPKPGLAEPGRLPGPRLPRPRIPASRLGESGQPESGAQRPTLPGRATGERIQEAQDRPGEAHSQLDETASLIHDIVRYAQLAMVLLLATAALPAVPLLATQRLPALGLNVLIGLAGLAFTGSCAILSHYLGNLELLGRTVPLQSGFWVATVGCAILGITASILVWQSRQRYVLAVVLLLPLVWTAYFAYLLGIF